MATSTSPTPASEGGSPEEPPSPETRRGSIGRWLLEWVVVLAGAVVVALLIKTFVIQAFYIPSVSMEPTLLENDRVLVDKVTYRIRPVARGDVIVFEHPTFAEGREIKDLIKRVVGLPGERIHFEDAQVHIDGEPLDEPYLPAGSVTVPAPPDRAASGTCTRSQPCTIPEGAVWVLGDNRPDSEDSRYIGPVPLDKVIGRGFVIVLPPNRIGGL